MVDSLVVELDNEACLLIGDVIKRLRVNPDEVKGLIINKFTEWWLPMNPFVQRIFYVTNDDGQFHLDPDFSNDFVAYINFMDGRGEARGVSLISKQKKELWN